MPPTRLYTYAPPWHALGYNASVSSAVAATYHEVMATPVDDRFAYVGASADIVQALPRVLPSAPSPAAADFFFLPVHPWALCFANRVVVPGKRGRRLPWDRRSPPLVEREMDHVRMTQRWRMHALSEWPRADGDNHTHGGLSIAGGGQTCPAYQRMLAAVLASESWAHAPARHIWVFEFPHLLRAALHAEERGGLAPGERSNDAKMAMGLLLSQEDRWGDWRVARAQHRLVLVPFDTPSYFEFDEAAAAAEGGIRAYKTTLVSESSGSGVSCHRFDSARADRFACSDPALLSPDQLRKASALAVSHLPGGEVLSPTSRAAHYAGGMLEQKALLYNRSTFCVLVPGDSAMTPRLASFLAAACIPVLTMSVDFVPFGALVPWENISVSVSPRALLAYQDAVRARNSSSSSRHPRLLRPLPPNPLRVLAAMPERKLRAMQGQLLHYRHAFAFRRAEAPSAIHSIARELKRMPPWRPPDAFLAERRPVRPVVRMTLGIRGGRGNVVG